MVCRPGDPPCSDGLGHPGAHTATLVEATAHYQRRAIDLCTCGHEGDDHYTPPAYTRSGCRECDGRDGACRGFTPHPQPASGKGPNGEILWGEASTYDREPARDPHAPILESLVNTIAGDLAALTGVPALDVGSPLHVERFRQPESTRLMKGCAVETCDENARWREVYAGGVDRYVCHAHVSPASPASEAVPEPIEHENTTPEPTLAVTPPAPGPRRDVCVKCGGFITDDELGVTIGYSGESVHFRCADTAEINRMTGEAARRARLCGSRGDGTLPPCSEPAGHPGAHTATVAEMQAWQHARRQVSEAPPTGCVDCGSLDHIAATCTHTAECNCDQALSLAAQLDVVRRQRDSSESEALAHLRTLVLRDLTIKNLTEFCAELVAGMAPAENLRAELSRLPSGRWAASVHGPGGAWCGTSTPDFDKAIFFIVRRLRAPERNG